MMLNVLSLEPSPHSGGASARSRSVAVSSRVRVATILNLALAFLVLGNLARVSVGSVGVKDAPLLLNDFLILAVFSAGSLAAIHGRSVRLDRPAVLGLMFAAWGGISALSAVPRFGLTAFELVVSLAYLGRWLLYFSVYLVVINFVRRSDIFGTWRVIEASILLFAGFGILQSLFLPGFAQIVQPEANWDLQGHRLVSTLLDPNFAGMLILLPLLVMLGWMSFGLRVPAWKPLLLVAAVLLTISRSSLLALFIGGFVVAVVRGHSRRLLQFVALVIVLVIPFIPALLEFAVAFGRFSVEGSAMARVFAWARAILIFADNPIMGVGFNTFGFVLKSYGWRPAFGADFGSDGGLLFIAVMTGLVGLALYLGMVFLVLRRCRLIWTDQARSRHDRGLSLGVAAGTIALIVHSVFLNSLLYPFLMEVLWVLWGFVFLLRRSDEIRPTSPGASLMGVTG